MSKIKSEKAMAVTETVSPKDVTERGPVGARPHRIRNEDHS